MSNFMADLDSLNANSIRGNSLNGVKVTQKGSNMDLDMQSFLTLMITEMTNQGIDSTMDTSDMVNQMVQMQMVTALANMTDASIMSYAASLVGKEVTVAQINSDGDMEELVGVVKGTGTKNGEQVIFLDNDKYYKLSEIMAVGVLPKDAETGDPNDRVDPSDKVEDTGKPEGGDGTGGVDKPEDGGEAGGVDKTEGSGGAESADKTESSGTDAGQAEGTGGENNGADLAYQGENGVPEDMTT